MKYRYAYKSSDGVRHEADIEASSRDEVFESLRREGIRPIKVVASDGSKANGEIRVMGIPIRIFIVTLILAVVLAVAGTWAIKGNRKAPPPVVITKVEVKQESQSLTRQAMPLPRQEIHGSRRRLEIAPTNLFASTLETYLSKFAEPGRSVDIHKVPTALPDTKELIALLDRPIYFTSDEYTEYIDLKRITAGIKLEMKAFVEGGDSAEDYINALIDRQSQELAHREKAERRLQEMVAQCSDLAKPYAYWLKANAQLQSMGIYPLPLPDALRDYQFNLNLDE